MGPSFARLAPEVRDFHRLQGRHMLQGRAAARAPTSALARLLGRMIGTPPRDYAGPLRVEVEATPMVETWTRHYGRYRMASTLRGSGAELIERLGAATLTYQLDADEGELSMRLLRMTFLGIPCPRWLLPQVIARERGEGGRFHFDVTATVRWVGTVTAYRGYLAMPSTVPCGDRPDACGDEPQPRGLTKR